MASIEKALNRGVEFLQQGKPEQAAELYRQVLKREPQHPDALHLLSVATYQLGDPARAADYARRAIGLRPDAADYHSNLGRYLFSLGQLAESTASLQAAIRLAPQHALAHFNLGLTLSAAHRTSEAIAALGRYIELAPDDPGGPHQLGTLLLEAGKPGEAIPYFCRVVEMKPDAAEAFNNLGNAVQALGQAAESLPYYDRALALKSDYADAITNRGAALQAMGRFDDALDHYLRALAIVPGMISARGNLANLLAAQHRHDEAVAMHRQILDEQPNSAETWNNMGNSLQELGRFDQALAAYRRALEVNPRYYLVHNNVGNTLRRQGRYEEAIAHYREALAHNPRFVEALNNQAVALTDMGRPDQAAALYEKAMAIKPDYPDPLINLGNIYRDHSQPERAIALFRRALAMAPENPYVWNNLGCALSDQGEVPEALGCYRQTLARMPSNAHAHSNLLLNLHYTGTATPAEIFSAHCDFGARYDGRGAPFRSSHANSPDPGRLLRVGYVSADFRRHSVAFFLEPLLASHNAAAVEFYCYADVMRPDAETERFARLAGPRWRDIRGYNDERFAAAVRADAIDILVDLGGHTANSRLASFTTRPAPVQVSWLGYPDTTGLASIDWRITDSAADPPGLTEALHTEKLIRLDPSFLCFRPPDDAPPVRPLPALAGNPFTFGSFNNAAKISDQTVALWAAVLQAVPGSRLALKNKALGEAEARQRLLARFAAHGIAAERAWMSGPIGSLAGHLDAYALVDVALDTFPYAGTTTTCEAMWMGVPVVTLAGPSHVSRVGATLGALVTESADQYVAAAVRLAGDLPRLAELRMSLRERMQSSPLTDAAAFAARMEQAFRTMWRHWCRERGA